MSVGFNVIPYLSIPWVPHGLDDRGCDCWGLVRLVMLRERQVELPDFREHHDIDTADVRRVAQAYQAHTDELAVRIKEEEAVPFDAILMRTHQEPVHIGIISTPGRMLHMRRGAGPANVPIRGPMTSWSILGFYRWTALLAR